jgi:hypothetical protein
LNRAVATQELKSSVTDVVTDPPALKLPVDVGSEVERTGLHAAPDVWERLKVLIPAPETVSAEGLVIVRVQTRAFEGPVLLELSEPLSVDCATGEQAVRPAPVVLVPAGQTWQEELPLLA